MTLTLNEESLVNAVRALPPKEQPKVLAWVTHLADLGRGEEIEWSDSWTDQDMADAGIVSATRFDRTENGSR